MEWICNDPELIAGFLWFIGWCLLWVADKSPSILLRILIIILFLPFMIIAIGESFSFFFPFIIGLMVGRWSMRQRKSGEIHS